MFVSRNAPSGADAGQIPGLGPHGSTIRVGGWLMVRERDGRVRGLLPPGAMWDVADPDVSFDGEWIAFSGLAHPDSPWGIFVVRTDGTGLHQVVSAEGDAIDPCWLNNQNDQLLYVERDTASRSLYDRSPAGRLMKRHPTDGGHAFETIQHEANGLLDPCVDLAHRRLVYSRWWFNPWRPARDGGITRDAARAIGDSVNQWQVVSARFVPSAYVLGSDTGGLTDERVAAGGVPDRRAGMGVQPTVLRDGRIAAVYARNTGLAPRPGPTGVQIFGPAPSPGRPMAGAAIGDGAGDPYTEASGLAAPSACAPAALPDGRLVFAMDRGGRGDFGLWIAAPGGTPRPLLDLPGTLELDPVPVIVRAMTPSRKRPERIASGPHGRYENRDVFAGHGAPRRTPGARLRLYQLASDDSVALAAEVPVGRRGEVSTAFDGFAFEQLVGPDGRVLMTAHGLAQVRGFNRGNPSAPSRCAGCHLGHSTMK